MRTALLLSAALLISLGLSAQSEPACPASRPVDDFIAEIHHRQSKSRNRNKNPLPSVPCIFGWCPPESKKTPPLNPDAPPPKPSDDKASAESSSKNSAVAVDPCTVATDQALEAAHQVEVADFNFQQENYRGALSRYQEAAEKKPGDVAIEVRIGRAYEKLHDTPNAIRHYKAASKLQGPEKWTQEANAAIERLAPK